MPEGVHDRHEVPPMQEASVEHWRAPPQIGMRCHKHLLNAARFRARLPCRLTITYLEIHPALNHSIHLTFCDRLLYGRHQLSAIIRFRQKIHAVNQL